MMLVLMCSVNYARMVSGFSIQSPTSPTTFVPTRESRIISRRYFERPLATDDQGGDNPILNIFNGNDDDDDDVNDIDTRSKRIYLPLQIISSLSFINSSPANAGIGTVIPFDVTRQEKFSGSIMNSVTMLRLNSTLRKRGYVKKNALVATLKPRDELVLRLAQDFGTAGDVTLLSDASSIESYVQTFQQKSNENNKNYKALVLYGKDVDISPEGDMSEIKGNDFKESEKLLVDSLATKGISDVTLIGGIVIHRAKTGGKDAGEDCFYPVAMTSYRKGVSTDLFEKVFGDLPTPRQTVSLPGLF